MASEYNPENPILTLAGTISGSPIGRDKYNISDNTGLGPNGSDKFISFNIDINNIESQLVGDSSVRDSRGISVGGQYTGIDIKVGDWVSNSAGNKIYKITSISLKTDTSISCVIEDVGMTIARSDSGRNNSLIDGDSVVIFEVNDEGDSLIALNQLDTFAGGDKYLQVEQYFKIYKPFQRFTLYPENTGSLKLGDFVTITGSGTPYTLITASQEDTVIGTVADLYGGNNVNIRPFNKIITNFDKPELISGGEIGTTWYLSGSNTYTTSSGDGAVAKFFQLTDSRITQITGSFDNPTFNTTQYNLELNNIDVIPQDIGGSTLTLDQIVSTINSQYDLTQVSSSIDERGGGFASTSTSGEAGSGGSIGSLAYSPECIIVLDSNPGGVGDYSSTATGEFSISHTFDGSTISFNVKPTTANATYSGYPVANEEQIVSDINSASQLAGAPVTATFGENTITISATSEGTITINNEVNDPFGTPSIGASSGTGISSGTFSSPPIEKYLTLYREDGGDIIIGGSWIFTPEGANLYSVSGTPPYLLMLEGSSGGADTDWFEGDTYLSASKDVHVTGSLLVTRDNAEADFLIISSGSYDAFKVNSEGIAQFFAYEDTNNPIMTPEYGGLLFMSSSVWVAINAE